MTPEKCPLCGAQIPKTTGRTHIDGTTTYTQYGCDSCLVQFWWPLKNPGTEWYRTNEKYGNRNADPVWDATTNHKKTIAFFFHLKKKHLSFYYIRKEMFLISDAGSATFFRRRRIADGSARVSILIPTRSSRRKERPGLMISKPPMSSRMQRTILTKNLISSRFLMFSNMSTTTTNL